MWSLKTGGLWWQVELHWSTVPSARNIRSFKTGGLSWQWSLKTGFTVFCTVARWQGWDPSRDWHISTVIFAIYRKKAGSVISLMFTGTKVYIFETKVRLWRLIFVVSCGLVNSLAMFTGLLFLWLNMFKDRREICQIKSLTKIKEFAVLVLLTA